MIRHLFVVPTLVVALSLCVAPPACADEPTDHLTVTQWVQPTTPGVFEARVVVPRGRGNTAIVQNALVRLTGPRNTVHRGVTDEEGNVVIKDVAPGVYALTVRARGLVGWQAMHIVGPGQSTEGTFAEKATLSPALISTEQFETMILPFLEQEYSIDSLSIVDVEVEKLVGQVRGNETATVAMTNGGLLGNVYAATTRQRGVPLAALEPAIETQVFLIRGRSRVDQTVTDASGRFFFSDLRPGVYSMVMANRDGLGAVSFELVAEESGGSAASFTTDGKVFVQENAGTSQFAFQVAPTSGETQTAEILSDPLPVGGGIVATSPAGLGGLAGGGLAGAGGAAGAAGGLGGAAGAGGVGALGAAAAGSGGSAVSTEEPAAQSP